MSYGKCLCILHYILFQLEAAQTVEEMRALLDSEEFEFRFDVGVSDVSMKLELSDRDRIVQSLATYFTVVRVKAQIDQMIDGLNTLGIYDLIRANPCAMHKLFVSRPEPITSDFMIRLFETRLSPEGSNRREDEEQVVMCWVNFIDLIECKESMITQQIWCSYV